MKWYLDFGHGGKDSGALGPKKTKESDSVLKIGMLVKNKLEAASETVITTRETDKYYTLTERSSKSNNNKCDYFVSLHFNASTNTNAKGCEVWVYDENSKLYTLSKNLCTNLSQSLNTPNRGVKISKQFPVLKNTTMPALLIEIDFISNSQVETSLSSDDYIQTVAITISSTLLSFVNKTIPTEDIHYKVLIGAFKDKANAISLKQSAISKGFTDAYILYRIIIPLVIFKFFYKILEYSIKYLLVYT